jgi:hypothetical protein
MGRLFIIQALIPGFVFYSYYGILFSLNREFQFPPELPARAQKKSLVCHSLFQGYIRFEF